jgi:hypothetical protein
LLTPNVDDVIKVLGSPKFGWLNKLKPRSGFAADILPKGKNLKTAKSVLEKHELRSVSRLPTSKEVRSSQKSHCATIHLSTERLRPTGGEFADFFDSFRRCRGGKMWRTVTRLAECHKPNGE